jgi:cyclic-di-AMP phosphodiesterase PgpH
MKPTKTHKRPLLSALRTFLHIKKRDKYLYLAIFFSYPFVLFLLILLLQPGPLFQSYNSDNYEIGNSAKEDVVLERNILYIDEKATELKYRAIKQLVYPVFRYNTNVTERVLSEYEDFASKIIELYTTEISTEVLFLRLQTTFPGLFSEEEVAELVGTGQVSELVSLSYNLLKRVMDKPVLEFSGLNRDFILDTIEVFYPDENRQRELSRSEYIVFENLKSHVDSLIEKTGVGSSNRSAVYLLLSSFVEPNSFYDRDATEKKRAEAIQDAQPVIKRMQKGDTIIRKGSVITDDDIEQIEQLKKQTAAAGFITILRTALFLLLIYGLAFILFRPPFVKTAIKTENSYILLGMFLFFLLIALFFKQFDLLPEQVPFSVLLPTSLLGMLTAILINARTSVVFSLLLSLTIFLFHDAAPLTFLFALFSGVSGALVVQEAQRRIDLIKATMYLSLISGGIIAVCALVFYDDPFILPVVLGWGALNGFFCGFLNLGILPILEHIINEPTVFRLMELSDTNTPILKKMLTLAPGTYSHSLNVANLSESACREIGANSLIARVGAYYHDIGKIDQAEYFIENQKADNKHDDLKPSLSVAVIKSHVKIGIEKAKELKLPKSIVDIISQHHGSGLISYFYSEALKDKKNTKVTPEDYSYSESPPKSREAAVVMLADTVDAATRTLKKPSIAKLEKAIWDLIMQRFREKQLNDSDLTLKDLEIIRKTFVQILAGYFHSRIEYPRTDGEKN